MPDSGVIQEFLVSIGFKTDQASFNVAKKLLSDVQVLVDKVAGSLDKASVALGSLANNQSALKTVQALNDSFGQLTTKIDESTKAAAGFSDTMNKDVDKAVRNHQDNMRRNRDEQDKTRSGLLEFGKVGLATFTAFAAQVRNLTKQYSELYYVAQRTGATADSIKALGFGIGQAGLNTQQAAAALTHMADVFDKAPGKARLFEQFGSKFLADIQKAAPNIDDRAQKLFAFLEGMGELSKTEAGMAVALRQVEETLGVSTTEARRLIDERRNILKQTEEAAKRAKDAGVSFTEASKISNQIEQTWGKIYYQIELIRTKSLQEIGKPLLYVLELLDDILVWVTKFNNSHPGAATIETIVGLGGAIWVVKRAISAVIGAFQGVGPAANAAASATEAASARKVTAIGGVAKAIGSVLTAYSLISAASAIMEEDKKHPDETQEERAKRKQTGIWEGLGFSKESAEKMADPNWMRNTIKGWFGGGEQEPAATAPIPHNARGGMVTRSGAAYVEAGEVVLPPDLVNGLRQMTARRPDGMGMQGEGGRSIQRLGDWLTGTSLAPKVVIDNIDEFVREFIQGLNREAKAGGGRPPGGTSPQSVMGRSGEAAGAALGRIGQAMGGAGGAVKAGMEEAAKTVGDTVKDALGGGGGIPDIKKGDVRNQAIDYFTKQGWTREQAAGIAASLERESSWNPKSRGDSGKAFGLGQWHPDRQANFKKQFGKDISEATIGEQLAFVNWELNNTEKGAGDRLRGAKSASEAGSIVSQYYERPRDRRGEASYRGGLAENILKGYTPGGEGGGGGGAQAGGVTTAAAGAGAVIEMQQKTARVRKQAIQDELRKQLQYAGLQTGLQAEVHSGGQDAHGPNRVGSHRHDEGGAADLDLRDVRTGKLLDMTKPEDQARMQAYLQHAVAAGATGIGGAEGYMGSSRLHIGGGSEAAWGAGGASANAPGWVRASLNWGLNNRISAKQRDAEIARLQQSQLANSRQDAQQQVQRRDTQAAQTEAYNIENPPMQMARGGLIPRLLMGGAMPALLHAGEMVLPRHLSEGLQGIIGGFSGLMGRGGLGGVFGMLNNIIGGGGGRGGLGGMMNMLGGIGGGGGLGGMMGMLGGFGGMRLGGDISNFARNNSMTLNQTYNNTFNGGPNEMLGAYRQSQERWTGDLVRNFRTAMI